MGSNKTIFLMHNLDDIFISAEDVVYLEKVFGRRAMFALTVATWVICGTRKTRNTY